MSLESVMRRRNEDWRTDSTLLPVLVWQLLTPFAILIEPRLPFLSKWEFHQGIVPLEEDYFDYNPVMTKTASGFVVLTKENVSSFEFKNFKVNIKKIYLPVTLYNSEIPWNETK